MCDPNKIIDFVNELGPLWEFDVCVCAGGGVNVSQNICLHIDFVSLYDGIVVLTALEM